MKEAKCFTGHPNPEKTKKNKRNPSTTIFTKKIKKERRRRQRVEEEERKRKRISKRKRNKEKKKREKERESQKEKEKEKEKEKKKNHHMKQPNPQNSYTARTVDLAPISFASSALFLYIHKLKIKHSLSFSPSTQKSNPIHSYVHTH